MKKLRLISLLAAAAVTQGLCTAVNAENLNTAQIRGKDALTALLSSAGAADPDAETAQICAILSQAGIDDVSSLINPGTRLTSVGQSDCKDLNDDGVFDAVDSMYILHFLQGKKNYQHAYSDMDANHDDIIDETDAYAYTRYYVRMLALGYDNNNIPYSAHNSGSAPTVASESMTYIKHNYSDGVNFSSNDVYYYLGDTNGLTSNNQADLPHQATQLLDEINSLAVPDPSNFTMVQDTRVVRCQGGTGAIVGDHLILTNAHVVFSSDNNQFVMPSGNNNKVCACTFSSTGEPTFHDLHVISYHVPMSYISPDESWLKHDYDYALIVVQEDLYDYGKFTLGVPLDTASTNQTSIVVSGYPQCPPCTVGYRKYNVECYGNISSMVPHQITTTAKVYYGSSGSPMFAYTYDNNTSYTSQLAIQCTATSNSSNGVRVILPILRFVYNNPFL